MHGGSSFAVGRYERDNKPAHAGAALEQTVRPTLIEMQQCFGGRPQSLPPSFFNSSHFYPIRSMHKPNGYVLIRNSLIQLHTLQYARHD